MPDIHIEEFYHDVACILTSLYATFPRLSTVYVEDIAGPDTVDEYGLHSERHLSCFSTLLWLKKHQLIHFEDCIRQEAVDQATLTQSSFLVLNTRAGIMTDQNHQALTKLPAYLAEAQISNINILRQALKSASAIKKQEIVIHILERCHTHH
ncbi:MAG: hypothetical protein HRU20_31470 [Pseudomonadales bacterium]|nr:hypothetical protein [Pseudomonadales bacterium]